MSVAAAGGGAAEQAVDRVPGLGINQGDDLVAQHAVQVTARPTSGTHGPVRGRLKAM